MATEITSLSVRFGADLAGFQRGMRQVQRGVREAESSFAGLSQQARRVTSVIGGVAAGLASLKLVGLAKDAALTSARFDTLGVVMVQVGQNAGYTASQMHGFERALRQTGISMIGSRDALAKLAAEHIDLANATHLARVAQDAAVIGGINSTEAFGRMVTGIANANTVILRGIGLNVDFEASYRKLAAELGKTVGSLTEAERSQARVNAVLESGANIAGTYEASMESAGKVIGSIPRQLEDLRTRLGAVFNETVRRGAFGVYDWLSRLNKALEELGDHRIEQWGRNLARGLGLVRDAAIAASVALAGRFAVSLGQAAVASVAKTRASIAEARAQAASTKAALDGAVAQVNMARAMGRTTAGIHAQRAAALQLRTAWQAHTAAMAQASVMARTAAASMGVLRGAFALLGGWPGIIVTALGGLVFWLQRTKMAAADAASEVRRAVMDTAADFAELNKAATLRQMGATSEKIGELEARLKDLRAELGRTPIEYGGGSLGAPRQESLDRRAEIEGQIEEVTRELEIQKGVAEELAKQYGRLARVAGDVDDVLDDTRGTLALTADNYDRLRSALRDATEDLQRLKVERAIAPGGEALDRVNRSIAETETRLERLREELERFNQHGFALRPRIELQQTIQDTLLAFDPEPVKATLAKVETTVVQSVSDMRGVLAEQGAMAGEALMRGLLSGANNMRDVLKNALVNLAVGYVMGPIKLALGIASPSKVFREYGEALGDGLVVGIQSRTRSVQAAIGSLTSVVTPALPSTVAVPAVTSGGAPGGMSAREIMDALGPMPEPISPHEAATHRWYRDFIAAAIPDYQSRGGRFG